MDNAPVISVVVVEDDAGMRASLQFLLESYGFEVVAFESPDALLTRFDGLRPDCAIFDVHLPGGDGLDLYRSLAKRVPGLPVIFITGQMDDQIKAEARRAQAVALLEKPFSDEVLLDAVGRAVAEPTFPAVTNT